MNIQKEVNLQPYNTFQFQCIADHFIAVQSPEALQVLLQTDCWKTSSKKLILGGGSNILLTKDRFDGLVIKNEILGKEIIKQTEKLVTIRVGGGENRDDFVQRTIDEGYCGIENLISIPGSVGAAPMQNIGAYGVETKSVIMQVEYLHLETGEIRTLSNKECAFGYRHSIFKDSLKGKAIITHVTFILEIYNEDTYTPQLSYGAIVTHLEKHFDKTTPQTVSKSIAAIRASKLPDRHSLGTAGSFFKNPELSPNEAKKILAKHAHLVSFPGTKGTIKFSAGQIIDLAGCKGMIQGNVGTYGNHALVLIHLGGGKGEEIVALAENIVSIVNEKFGVQLVPEVNYIS